MTGSDPVSLIDHIDGVRINNAWDNLRQAANEENGRNRGASRNNTSGYKGVSFDKRAGRYEAYVNIGGRKNSLGLFETAELANTSRQKEILLLGLPFMR